MGLANRFINQQVDGFNSDALGYARQQTSFYGGTKNKFTVPSSPTYPDADAGTPTRYIYFFPGVIDVSDFGTRDVIIRDVDTATVLTRVSASPNANEFRVVTNVNSESRGMIEFNSAQSGHVMDNDLYIIGSVLSSDEITNLNNESVTTDDLTVSSQGYLVFKDIKADSVEGGTFSSGDWRTRDITNEVTDTGGHGSLSSNQITLAAGTYYIDAKAPAYKVSGHQARLYNISDASTEIIGSTEVNAAASSVQTASYITGVFTITSTKVFEVQHRCDSSSSSQGFGRATIFTVDNNIYTTVTLIKLS